MLKKLKPLTLRIFTFILLCSMICAVFSSCSDSRPYNYELSEYLEIPENWEKTEVSENEITMKLAAEILKVRENSAIETEITNRAAGSGDKVTIDVVCYRSSEYGNSNAKPIEELSASGRVLILGERKYPSEFENAIVGHRLTDKFAVRLTLPGDFGLSELVYQTVVYEITLNAITELQLPLYNDAFVRSVSSCMTIKEYEEMMRKRVYEELIWENILASCEVKGYPQKEYNTYEHNYIKYYTDLASDSDQTLEEYIRKQFNIELTAFQSQAVEYARRAVKEEMLLYSFVRDYGLELTDAEYTEGAETYVQEYGMRSLAALERRFGSAFVRKSVQFDKVLTFIGDSVVFFGENTDTDITE